MSRTPPSPHLSLLLAAALSLAAVPASAGPWTKKPGALYAKLGEGFFVANSFLDSQGQVITGTDYFGATTSLSNRTRSWMPYFRAQPAA